MTSRRGKVIEDGARQILQLAGYSVRVVPVGYRHGLLPAHLVAGIPGEPWRLICIRKISRRSPGPDTVLATCGREILRFRRFLTRSLYKDQVQCEIWIYSLTYRFRCFAILADEIKEIPIPSSHWRGS